MGRELKTLTDICNEVEKEHHALIRKSIAEIEAMLVNLVEDEAETFPFLVQAFEQFQEVSDLLAMHIQKEELIILPYIRKLEECASKRMSPPEAHFPTLRIPIEFIDKEHELIVEGLLGIRSYTTNYFIPAHADNVLSELYSSMKKFEQTLIRVVKIEGETLYPKAIKLEAELHNNH